MIWNLFLHHLLDADLPSHGIERITYVNADQREKPLTLTLLLEEEHSLLDLPKLGCRPQWTCLSWIRTGSLKDSRDSRPRDSEVVVESTPPEASPSYLIDILFYRMRHPLEVCILFSAGPASAFPSQITSLRIWFGTTPIPGTAFASSLPPAIFSSSRMKSPSHWITQELKSCLWNDPTYGNKFRIMYLTRSALSNAVMLLLAANLLATILKTRPHGSFSTSPIKSFHH